MNAQEIIQAKVIAIQSVGPGGSIAQITERFEFLIGDQVEEAFRNGYAAAHAEYQDAVKVATE